MGKGKVLTRLAVIGAAIAGVVFFWRKKQEHEQGAGPAPAFPPAADRPE